MNKWRRFRIYFSIGFLVLTSCRETQFNYNCGIAPSTPTELTITNNTNHKTDVILSVKETQLNKFKDLSLMPGENIELCIEYEGPITDGIHINFENQTTTLKLRPQQSNRFTLKGRILR